MSTKLRIIQERSASPAELVLNFDDVLVALGELERGGARIIGWEGWLRYADGRVGHSERHQGTANLDGLERSATFDFCRRTIREAHEAFCASPENSARELLFCLTHDV